MTFKRLVYAVCIVVLLFGVWGVYNRLAHGHQDANYGSYVVWGLWVAMYLFFAGVAAGCFMLATLDLLFRVEIFKGTGRLALWVGLVSLGAGLFQIWLDLGHLDRIWKVYLQGNPQSVMAQMVWGYTLFGLLMIAALVLATRQPDSKALRVLMIVGLPLSLFVSGAVGALLGVQASRPFWHVGLFPVQFPVFSLASGVAAMMAVIGLFGSEEDPNRPKQLWVLAIATVVLAVVKLYFLWADYSQSLYGNVPHNVAAVREVLFGRWWWSFWIVQLLLGTIVPVVVLLTPKWRHNPAVVGWMGVLVLIGFAAARSNIVFPALTVPELEALTRAFSDRRLTFEYAPSLMEWAVTLGSTAAAVLAVLIGAKLLHLMPEKEMA
ncbi:MAG: NrfD/PsrC family molybdoenzyme membrane anchor subunit [Anaerolineae bacterium]|nr:NrfD/PsrC family molybdoenzyme membrane anchor subunit [Anaerolineae bacterium]